MIDSFRHLASLTIVAVKGESIALQAEDCLDSAYIESHASNNLDNLANA